MIQSLKIQNYALIDHIDIDFYPGLLTITGETGAGKSILIGALSLILGNRADTSAIKDEERKCLVEATFDIEKYLLQDLFIKNDLDYEPNDYTP
jgi:DNA repair protein RecN (Recombination protein N)